MTEFTFEDISSFQGKMKSEFYELIAKELKKASAIDAHKFLLWETETAVSLDPYFDYTDKTSNDFQELLNSTAFPSHWNPAIEFDFEDLGSNFSIPSLLTLSELGSTEFIVRNSSINPNVASNFFLDSLQIESEFQIKYLLSPASMQLLQKEHFTPFFSENQRLYLTISQESDAQLFFDKTNKSQLNLWINSLHLTKKGGTLSDEIAAMLFLYNTVCTNLGSSSLTAVRSPFSVVFELYASGSLYLDILKVRALRTLLTLHEITQPQTQNGARCDYRIHFSIPDHLITTFDSQNNVLRSTLACFTGIIGGADSISLPAYDKKLNRQGDSAIRLSLLIHQLLRHESLLGTVKDASRGSYFFDKATEIYCEAAWGKFLLLIDEGGLDKSLSNGKFGKDFNLNSEKRKAQYRNRKRSIIGISKYANVQEEPLARQQLSLEPNDSLFNPIFEFESVRLKIINASKKRSTPIAIALLVFGDTAKRNARADFAADLFASAAIRTERIVADTPLPTLDNFFGIVFCSSDEEYPAMTELLMPLIPKKLPILIAGKQPNAQELTDKGISDFIYLGMNAPDFLRRFTETFILS